MDFALKVFDAWNVGQVRPGHEAERGHQVLGLENLTGGHVNHPLALGFIPLCSCKLGLELEVLSQIVAFDDVSKIGKHLRTLIIVSLPGVRFQVFEIPGVSI